MLKLNFLTKTTTKNIRINQITQKLNLNKTIKNFSLTINNNNNNNNFQIKDKIYSKSFFSINYTSKFFTENIAISKERKEESKNKN
jgi:hypothetical protein